MDNFEKQMRIRDLISDLREEIDSIKDTDEKIDTLNYVRSELHSVSPLKDHPDICALWVNLKKALK